MASQVVPNRGLLLSLRPSDHDTPTQLPDLLPSELWLHIFSYLLQNRPFLPSFQSGVLILSWVCHRWRAIVISTPSLWTTIHLFNNRVAIGKREREEKLVELCLKRSEGCKLDIILTDLLRNRSVEARKIHSLTLPLCFLNQSHRWKTLRLEISIGGKILERLSTLKGHLELLESCTIMYKWKQGLIAPIFNSFDFLENTPQLRKLCFSNRSLVFQSNAPFSQLTVIDLVPDTNSLQFASTINESLDILERCPNLRRYRLVCDLSVKHDLLARPPTTHRNIRELHIFEHCTGWPRMPQEDGGTIFKFLDLPFLTSLSITSHEPWTVWNVVHSSLDDFLGRTRGELLRLELRFTYQTNFLTEHLKRLRLTPKLQDLFVLVEDMNYSRDDVLHGLSESDGSFIWPPALHRLYYWTIDRNSTFAISSTPYWKCPSSYLQRSTIIQEGST